MRYLYILLLAGLITVPGLAQRVTNIQANVIGNYVSIHYDLEEEIPGQVFEVALYSSHNDYEQPLRYVRGEIGSNITSGKQKEIEWGAQKELSTQFEGDITFEVRAQLVFSPLVIQNPQTETVFRRGHIYKLEWKGGLAGEKLRLELIRDGHADQAIDNVINTGSYTWRVSDDLPLAENYRLRIIGRAGNGINTRTSDLFTIKRRIPLIAKFIPVGIVAGAAVVWLGGKLSSSTEDEGPILPLPPQDEL